MIPASARADWWGSAEGNAYTLVENARFLKLWPEGREGHHAGVEMPLVWFGLGSYPCHIFHPYWKRRFDGEKETEGDLKLGFDNVGSPTGARHLA
jgi:hypothetical protein